MYSPPQHLMSAEADITGKSCSAFSQSGIKDAKISDEESDNESEV
jgi:hypothetical protein